jgi:hypothetical protein
MPTNDFKGRALLLPSAPRSSAGEKHDVLCLGKEGKEMGGSKGNLEMVNVVSGSDSFGVPATLGESTKQMLVEAVSAGFYESRDLPGCYLRLQILTIAELLEGKKIQYPEHRVKTFAKPERKTKHAQEEMF